MNIQSNRVRRIALAVLGVATLLSVPFALRTYHSFLLLRSAYEVGAPLTSGIRPWMTLNYVAVTYRTPEAALRERLGIPAEADPSTSLKSLADRAGISPSLYARQVQRAIGELSPAVASDRKNGTTGWLGAFGDEVLTGLLVYGYPVLGLTLLLGSIGLPLPDGFAVALAGSLAAQGRMNAVWAVAIAATAAVMGDVAGYGIGRVLNESVLDRWGRWFGYTRVRAARVHSLFEQWGALTVFITRTFISYLSSVASLLAGVSRYRLSKFLAVAVAGRLLWTVAYLGLGYAIGSDLQAATDFLTNLGALLSLLVMVAGSALVASGAVIPMSPRSAP